MSDKQHRKVYIIESLSPQDTLDGRKEGVALSEILTLAGIKNSYYNVVNTGTFTTAIASIVNDINKEEHTFGVVDMHFSMHGNKNGIALTCGGYITWVELHKYLQWINGKVGYMQPKGVTRKFSPINLNFSVCEGFNAKVLDTMGEESAYTSIVGPNSEVEWSDSLMAFSSYYHNTIHKGVGWQEATVIMNIAAGLKGVFEFATASGLQEVVERHQQQ